MLDGEIGSWRRLKTKGPSSLEESALPKWHEICVKLDIECSAEAETFGQFEMTAVDCSIQLKMRGKLEPDPH